MIVLPSNLFAVIAAMLFAAAPIEEVTLPSAQTQPEPPSEGASPPRSDTADGPVERAGQAVEGVVHKTGKVVRKVVDKTTAGVKSVADKTGKAVRKVGEKIEEVASPQK